MKLSCRCRNITLHIYDTKISPIELDKFGITDKACADDDFFLHGVCPVDLTSKQITEEIPYLVKKYNVGDWEISACFNCNHLVYGANAFMPAEKQIVVNCGLVVDDGEARRDDDGGFCYSPAFRLMLDRDHLEQIGERGMYGMELRKHSVLESVFPYLNDKMSTYMDRETKAMDERVKYFIENEKEELEKKRKQTQREKVVLLKQLQRLEDECGEVDNAELEDESPVSVKTDASSHSGGKQESYKKSNNKENIIDMREVGLSLASDSLESRNSSTSDLGSEALASEALFDMDDDDMLEGSGSSNTSSGYHAGILGRNQSQTTGEDSNDDDYDDEVDDEGDDDDDDNEYEGFSTDKMKIACSLPMQVPNRWLSNTSPPKLLPLGNQQQQQDDEEDSADIGARIRALAHSLHEGDTPPEVPRPRFNTVSGHRRN